MRPRLLTLAAVLCAAASQCCTVSPGAADEPVRVAVLDSGVSSYAAFHFDAIKGEVGTVDEFGHGTHVASILTDSFPQVAVLDIKVLDARGRGTADTVCRGLDTAAEADAQVVLMSLGFYREPQGLRACVDRAVAGGMTLIAAVGDNMAPQSNYPAAYEDVIAVAAQDGSGRIHTFSARGKIDFAEDGVNVRARNGLGEYDVVTGSSFAVPLFAAKLLSHGTTKPAQHMLDGYASFFDGRRVPTIRFARN